MHSKLRWWRTQDKNEFKILHTHSLFSLYQEEQNYHHFIHRARERSLKRPVYFRRLMIFFSLTMYDEGVLRHYDTDYERS